MSYLTEVRAVSAPPGLALGARGLIRWVCTSNPFYVLSALLVCLGLWISFGAQVRAEQTWALMFGMATYTLLLAVPACLLVRYGGVWQDVRTVLLLVVLMFLATSVTFDETLARSPGQGITCYLGGFVFAIAVSEGLLRGMRLRLPGWFRTSYYLILALFFLYPVALVPLLDRPRSEALQWALFGFGPLAALISLSLLPAIRRGPEYVRDNGSPWRWPLYPWSLFVFLGFGVAARSFLLCWSMQHVPRTDPERYIFGPYFLVPLGMAVAVLLLELGLSARNRIVIRTALFLPAALIVLASIGHRPDTLYREFLMIFVARLGATPLFLTLVASASFYTYAALRRVALATELLSIVLAMLAVLGPGSFELNNFVPARSWPVLVVAALQLKLGLSRHEGWRCVLGVGCLFASVWLAPEAIPQRGPLGFHLAWAMLLVLGAAFDDGIGWTLRTLAAAMAVLAALAVLSGRFDPGGSLPSWAIAGYPPVMASLTAAYGVRLRHRPALIAAAMVLSCWLAALVWQGYCSLKQVVVGLDFIATGLALLALAEGISLAKSGLLSRVFTRDKGRVSQLPD
jgi:hypothetical protein